MAFVRIFTDLGWVRKGAPLLPGQVGLGYGVAPYGLSEYGG